MKEFLKKHLLTKWWFPLLFFIISFFLFITDSIITNSDFSFFILILSGMLLLISSIWQLIKGSKFIALMQFIVLITPILILGFIFYITASIMNKPDGKLSQESIELIIKEKTDLIIPKEFTVMENLIEHTEGAFDSDYSITLTIEYKEIEENYIINQILKSLDNNTDKGIWKKNNSGFDFIHSDNEDNRAEPFYFEIDTLINKIELNLTHL